MMVENGDMSFVENDLMIYGDLMFDNFDELLDFSSEEEAKLLSEPLPCPSSSSDLDPPPPPPPTSNQVDNSLSADDDNATLLCDDLDVAQLEWLSHFVEESFSPTVAPIVELPVTTTAVKKEAAINGVGHQYRTPSPISVLEQSSGGLQSNYSPSTSPSSSSSGILLPGGGPRKGQHHSPLPSPLGQQEPAARRRRSKRARPTALWASNSISLIPFPRAPESGESGSDSNSTTAKKKKLKDGYDSLVVLPPPVIHVGGVGGGGGGGGGGGRGGEEESPAMAPARRCMHCDVQKTPQWRAGPMGPKTLCNACGVRYKSGRLFPEYRPAASPTFSSSIHSNSHKKVVEMRNKVEPTFNDVAPLALKGCELLNYIRENNNGVGKKQQKIDRA